MSLFVSNFLKPRSKNSTIFVANCWRCKIPNFPETIWQKFWLPKQKNIKSVRKMATIAGTITVVPEVREKNRRLCCWNFECWAVQKRVNLVVLVKSFPTSIYLQKLASIQPRTSPGKKFAASRASSSAAAASKAINSRNNNWWCFIVIF